MRSFFKSNKSQSSIDRYNPSREGSPTHSEPSANNAAAYPPPAQTAPLTQRYPVAPPPASQYDGTPDSPEQRRYHEAAQEQTHPADNLSRSQSHRVASAGDAPYNSPGRPSVHIIGPSSPTTALPFYEDQRYPPPPQSQLQPAQPEKERRKSKRNILFSLHSSSKEPKEPNSPTSGQSRGPGRTGSFLRKTQQSLTISGPYPQASPGNPAHQEQNQEGLYQSQDSLTDSEDRTPNERFYQGHGPFDQPQSQPGVSAEAQRQGEQRYSQQPQQQYQGGPERHSEESIDIYHTYQQHRPQEGLEQDPAAFDPRQIRPPSQLSLLGPPSPGTQSADSRPSSATNLSHQSRFSTQSAAATGPLSPQQQQQIAMARGDPPPNGLRDQMSQQRDPRLDPGNPQYGGSQDPRSRVSQHADQGRSTPPPRNREDIGNMDFQTLLQRHEELQSKYSKVKRYYFEKDTQVTQLQNLIANQRLSMSKTMFDDHQYTSRFDRLNGAIRDLAFSIRKDWKGIPPWLTHVVNRDAHTVGTKEMTAVGRACITCWLMDEIFNRFFHPDLEPGLSSQLKLIEKTLRRSGNATQSTSDEQREDLTTKLITWRLATVEGLSDHLASPQAAEYRAKLVHVLSERLTAALKVNLPEITPAGLESGVGMIIELAVSIAQCLPMESRDIWIEYFMPGAPINDTFMKMEAPPALLTNPGVAPVPAEDSDEGGEGSPEDNQSKLENEIREAAGKAATTGAGRTESQSTASSKDSKAQKKGSFLGGLVTKKPAPPGNASAGAGISAKDAAEQAAENNEGKIRMAVFFAVEVRGKAGTGKEGGGSGGDKPVVLIRAPVFGY